MFIFEEAGQQSLCLKKSVGGMEAYLSRLLWDNGPGGGAAIKRKVPSSPPESGLWGDGGESPPPCLFEGRHPSCLCWSAAVSPQPETPTPTPGTRPHLSKFYLHRLAEDSLGVSIKPLGQRDNGRESSSHPPPPAAPWLEARILGKGIVLVKTALAAGRPGMQSQLGDLQQINSLHLDFFIWKMEIIPTLKEEGYT